VDDKFSSEPRRRTSPDLVRVLSEPETVEALGLSRRTWDRLKSLGDVPTKTRLSEGRIGYRASDIATWLDARRETATARDLIDSNWKRVGVPAAAVVEKVARR
jgi:predicted DNA-binding transcriptional regulator AlpA